MARFFFRVVDPDGQARQGTLESQDLESARGRLLKLGVHIVELKLHQVPPPGRYFSRLIPPPQVRPFLYVAMGCLGVLHLVASYFAAPTAPRYQETPLCKIQVRVQGRLSVPGEDFEDASISLDFPEIPFRATRKWSELEHTAPDAYSMNLEFQSPRQPTKMLVRAA